MLGIKAPKGLDYDDRIWKMSMLLAKADEAQLVARAQAGDDSAFGLLVRNFESRAFTVAYRLVRNEEAARDLVQDAFLRAYKALGTFDVKQPFLPWFHRILKNLCINWIKKESRQKHDSLDEMADDYFVQFASGDPTQADVAENNELREQLWDAIENLDPSHREIISLFHFHNLSYDEIANTLAIPIGTVMSRLWNARRMLRKHMENTGRVAA